MKSDKKSRAFVKKLGKKIKELRKAQGISQAQLAFEADLQRQAVLGIEKGDQNPSAETLFSIACALNVPARDLFDFKYERRDKTKPVEASKA